MDINHLQSAIIYLITGLHIFHTQSVTFMVHDAYCLASHSHVWTNLLYEQYIITESQNGYNLAILTSINPTI